MNPFYLNLAPALLTSILCAQTVGAQQLNKVAAQHLKVAEDLEVTLWASTPLFNNPTNMDMDAHGRMWVAEGVNYRGHRNRRAAGDRIMVVQDTDNDGIADSSHCFVQDPTIGAPLGVSVFGNRIVVAQPPELIVYTDVDNNLKFDPKIDKREVLLSGFNGKQHDHSLHAVTAGPDGKWYINQGNCGAQITDKSGKTFYFGSSYTGGYNAQDWPHNPTQMAGKPSDDGFTWIASFIAKMNPDGTNLQVLGHNMRNPYEHTVNSFGDIFHSDNDDPPACRNAYLLEGGNAGFSSADGNYGWEAERRPGQDTPTAHWRQQDPGVMPAGDVYGSGSPTGVAFYENGALPKKYNGMFLACDAGRRDIMQYFPRPIGAGYSLDRKIFLKTDDHKDSYNFRPSDVEVGADGAIYVADWFDPRVGGHEDRDASLSGAIYRIAPKGFKAGVSPDFTSIKGQITLLKSPSDNVRFLGFELLKKQGGTALPEIKDLLNDSNPYIVSRALFLLPHLGKDGITLCRAELNSTDSNRRYAAFNALRSVQQLSKSDLMLAAADSTAQLRRAAATAIRTNRSLPITDKQAIIAKLYAQWDGKDRYMLEAIGLASHGNEALIWKALKEKSEQWSSKFTLITWRLHPTDALPQLEKRATNTKLTIEQRKLAIDTIAFTDSKEAPAAMLRIVLAGVDADYARMWLNVNLDGKKWDGLIDRELVATKAGVPKPNKAVPFSHPAPPKQRAIPTMKQITSLKGDVKKGELIAARCIICHEIGKQGKAFGPGLTGWGATRNKEQILNAILTPNADIAHGFEGHRVLLKNGRHIDGLVKSSIERSWHFVNNAGNDPYLVVVTMGGNQQKINWREIKKVEPLKGSLMLYPEQLGLTKAQDLADLTSYLQQLKK